MPEIKGKYDVIKISRPRGSRYAEGRAERAFLGKYRNSGQIMTVIIAAAITAAYREFFAEYGVDPDPMRTVVEVTVGGDAVLATVIELKEMP